MAPSRLLVGVAIERNQRLVERALRGERPTDEGRGDLPVDVRDCPADTLSGVARRSPSRSSSASRSPVDAPDGTAARPGTAVERDLDFDGRIAARIKNLACRVLE